jgi:hypothetical protein
MALIMAGRRAGGHDGQMGAGGYESWFLSARDPGSPRALWIRHTRHRPRQGPEAWLELVLARIRIGPARSPWTAMGALGLSGERIALGGLGRRSRVDAGPGRL